MNWRLFPKIFSHAKYAPYIALFYGFVMFYIGLTINQPIQEKIAPNQSASSTKSIPSKSQIGQYDPIKFLVSVLLSLGILKIFQDMIEDEGKEHIKEYHKIFLLENITKLKTKLSEAAIEPETRDECIKILDSISADKYFEKREAAVKVEKWLNKSNNVRKLLQNLPSQISVPKESQESFTNDIYNCLMWLKTSLGAFRSAKFDMNHLASAKFSKNPVGINDYKKALKYIKDDLESRSGHTGVVEDFVQGLVDYLSSKIS